VDGGKIAEANALEDDSTKVTIPIKKWTWYCPIENCKSHGWKGIRKTKARKAGRYHLERKHKIFGMDVILKPVDKDWRGCRYYEPNGKNKVNVKKVESIGVEQAFNMVKGKGDGPQQGGAHQ
jgi:hypothetical protein